MSASLSATTRDRILQTAAKFVGRSYAPYSSRQRACVLLLSDGSLVPGVRMENASFSILLTAVGNAFGTAISLDRPDIVAIGFSHEPADTDHGFLSQHPLGPFSGNGDRFFIKRGFTDFPAPGDILQPDIDRPSQWSSATGLELAAEIALRAYIPESNFPVGAILEFPDGRLIPGVNVEHPDWQQIVCAERNVIGTSLTYDLRNASAIYLTCPTDDQASPCGACRQILVELAPQATVWMHRGTRDAEQARVDELLPGFFSGQALHRKN